jgi:hypothetical protein
MKKSDRRKDCNHRILAENCRWKTHKKNFGPHTTVAHQFDYCLKTFETPAITINKLLIKPDREKEK